jgi:hypothetical protein
VPLYLSWIGTNIVLVSTLLAGVGCTFLTPRILHRRLPRTVSQQSTTPFRVHPQNHHRPYNSHEDKYAPFDSIKSTILPQIQLLQMTFRSLVLPFALAVSAEPVLDPVVVLVVDACPPIDGLVNVLKAESSATPVWYSRLGMAPVNESC